MEYASELSNNTLRVYLNGKLTFSDNASFQAISKKLEEGKVKDLEVGLDGLEYIDSSGIGMLLVLKEKCDEIAAQMTLSKPRGQVAKILRIACIDRVIPIVA